MVNAAARTRETRYKEGTEMDRVRLAITMAAAAVVSLLVLSYGPVTSPAQSTSPCAEDMKTVCSDFQKGGGRMMRCYEERKDRISTACRNWVEFAKSNAGKVREACAKEIDSSCNREKGDPVEMLDCLQSNYVDLSRPCAERLNTFKGMYLMPLQ
jgi:hypothetical protein